MSQHVALPLDCPSPAEHATLPTYFHQTLYASSLPVRKLIVAHLLPDHVTTPVFVYLYTSAIEAHLVRDDGEHTVVAVLKDTFDTIEDGVALRHPRQATLTTPVLNANRTHLELLAVTTGTGRVTLLTLQAGENGKYAFCAVHSQRVHPVHAGGTLRQMLVSPLQETLITTDPTTRKCSVLSLGEKWVDSVDLGSFAIEMPGVYTLEKATFLKRHLMRHAVDRVIAVYMCKEPTERFRVAIFQLDGNKLTHLTHSPLFTTSEAATTYQLIALENVPEGAVLLLGTTLYFFQGEVLVQEMSLSQYARGSACRMTLCEDVLLVCFAGNKEQWVRVDIRPEGLPTAVPLDVDGTHPWLDLVADERGWIAGYSSVGRCFAYFHFERNTLYHIEGQSLPLSHPCIAGEVTSSGALVAAKEHLFSLSSSPPSLFDKDGAVHLDYAFTTGLWPVHPDYLLVSSIERTQLLSLKEVEEELHVEKVALPDAAEGAPSLHAGPALQGYFWQVTQDCLFLHSPPLLGEMASQQTACDVGDKVHFAHSTLTHCALVVSLQGDTVCQLYQMDEETSTFYLFRTWTRPSCPDVHSIAFLRLLPGLHAVAFGLYDGSIKLYDVVQSEATTLPMLDLFPIKSEAKRDDVRVVPTGILQMCSKEDCVVLIATYRDGSFTTFLASFGESQSSRCLLVTAQQREVLSTLPLHLIQLSTYHLFSDGVSTWQCTSPQDAVFAPLARQSTPQWLIRQILSVQGKVEQMVKVGKRVATFTNHALVLYPILKNRSRILASIPNAYQSVFSLSATTILAISETACHLLDAVSLDLLSSLTFSHIVVADLMADKTHCIVCVDEANTLELVCLSLDSGDFSVRWRHMVDGTVCSVTGIQDPRTGEQLCFIATSSGILKINVADGTLAMAVPEQSQHILAFANEKDTHLIVSTANKQWQNIALPPLLGPSVVASWCSRDGVCTVDGDVLFISDGNGSCRLMDPEKATLEGAFHLHDPIVSFKTGHYFMLGCRERGTQQEAVEKGKVWYLTKGGRIGVFYRLSASKANMLKSISADMMRSSRDDGLLEPDQATATEEQWPLPLLNTLHEYRTPPSNLCAPGAPSIIDGDALFYHWQRDPLKVTARLADLCGEHCEDCLALLRGLFLERFHDE